MKHRAIAAALAFLSSFVGLCIVFGPMWFGEVDPFSLSSATWFFSRAIGFSVVAALPFAVLRLPWLLSVVGGAILGYAMAMWYVASNL